MSRLAGLFGSQCMSFQMRVITLGGVNERITSTPYLDMAAI